MYGCEVQKVQRTVCVNRFFESRFEILNLVKCVENRREIRKNANNYALESL
jgi:hypothetical protein